MSGAALGVLILGSLTAVQERAVIEVDHVFIHVDRATPVAERLQEAGFSVPPDTMEHTGQGTASRAIFFDNAYVELIWVTDATELRRADPSLAARMLD